MRSKKIALLVVMTLCIKIMIAQEGLPIYSDYLTDNYYLIHPSMAGASNCSEVRLTGRKNWVGEEDSPGLFTVGYNARITESSSIGTTVYQDKNGFHSQTGAYLTYAHHLMFSRSEVDLNRLSFGLSAGTIQYRLDQSRFVPNGDPIISSNSINTSAFNIDFGFSYHVYNFYIHLTGKNLLKNSGINNDIQITSDLRHYLMSVGYVIDKQNSEWSFEPSLLFSHRKGIDQSSIDFNLKAYKDMSFGKLWGGLSYRRSLDAVKIIQGAESRSQNLNYITPFLGVNYNKFIVAYTYSYQSNPIVFNNGGFHQITLGIDFSCRAKRYACYCPAVN
ncbi:type IX secretion system PorP/SprF family membrane protein [Aquimarina sp. MAR_2010_214]|uniref:PorP/SprF family type IX secretion system membrane protein n=1 Tax=Aquimarina sp. MAR_2010_214 TaxID=1250026 RepID=UPI000C713016|nr:type IX secretion system membrane protein PorP/SprF [Aquimarina sp. MAR_2010_214]PKV49252.1 type IX secretion system PorP/SprF family membrane protein [Aquimarina sp. MAR_2010_214]